MNATQLRDHIVDPVLRHMDMHSESAVLLLMGTAAHESHLGHYIVQRGGGPACGIYQMEPTTASDLLYRYAANRPAIASNLAAIAGITAPELLSLPHSQLRLKLISDLRLQTAMARLRYWMVPEPLPPVEDIRAIAEYYKAHYNTRLGKATPDDFIADYQRYVIGDF